MKYQVRVYMKGLVPPKVKDFTFYFDATEYVETIFRDRVLCWEEGPDLDVCIPLHEIDHVAIKRIREESPK